MPERARALLVVDVRPIIEKGGHPLTSVMEAAATLEPHGMLEVVAPFEPRPLAAHLRASGFEVRASPTADGAWHVDVARPPLPAVAEWADLPPPEPLERLLHAVAALPEGGVLVAHLPRDPRLARPELEARGLDWQVALRPDGTALLWARR